METRSGCKFYPAPCHWPLPSSLNDKVQERPSGSTICLLTSASVIKIADLCTSTQLEKDTRVWINVSRQLYGRGKEYRRRCGVLTTFIGRLLLINALSCVLRLEKITHAGNKGYFPANFKWNLAEKYDSSFTGSNLENLNAKELQDVCDFSAVYAYNN